MFRRAFFAALTICALIAGGAQHRAAPLFSRANAADTSQAQIAEITLGESTQGRPIRALRIGSGPRELWLVGNTHGGPEANTYRLLLALQDHFRSHPGEVPPEVSLYLVPTVNPDGLALQSRHNARNVDLNRNMNTTYDACPENDWRPVINGAYGQVLEAGGAAPESEVETQLVRDMLLGAAAVIFYHSDGGVVFPAACEHSPSIALAQTYASATGYTYSRYWENYLITGGMHDWAAALGIAAITPELLTGEKPDIDQNIAGVRAVLADTSALLPLPRPTRHANGVEVTPLIWRYWRSHGGEQTYGQPISPPIGADDAIIQYFEQARISLHPEQQPALGAFKVTSDGRRLWTQHLLKAPASPFQPR